MFLGCWHENISWAYTLLAEWEEWLCGRFLGRPATIDGLDWFLMDISSVWINLLDVSLIFLSSVDKNRLESQECMILVEVDHLEQFIIIYLAFFFFFFSPVAFCISWCLYKQKYVPNISCQFCLKGQFLPLNVRTESLSNFVVIHTSFSLCFECIHIFLWL